MNRDELKRKLDNLSSIVNNGIESSSSYHSKLKAIINDALGRENVDINKYLIELDRFINKVVKIGNEYYTIRISPSIKTIDFSKRNNDSMKSLVSGFVRDYFTGYNYADAIDNSYYVSYQYADVNISFEKVTNLPRIQTTFKIHTAREITQGVAYDMFAIPFGGKWSGGSTNREEVLKFITMLSSTPGSPSEIIKLIDAQILPYCPIDEIKVDGSGNLTFGNVDVQDITDGTNTIGKICWCKKLLFPGSSTNQLLLKITRRAMSLIITEYVLQISQALLNFLHQRTMELIILRLNAHICQASHT